MPSFSRLLFVLALPLIPIALLLARLLQRHDDELTTMQIRQLHEVADGMLAIYETLADMRYIDPEDIVHGPHDLASHQELYEELGLDPSIVYLYSILPYVDVGEGNSQSFFQGGSFADFRYADSVREARDPLYASPEGDFEEPNGHYMRPWFTSLTRLGNHESVIIYDAKEHRIWILDQLGGTTDLALLGSEYAEQKLVNRNALERYSSRPAGDVLRDIREWFRTLREVPRGEHIDMEWWDGEVVKETLLNNGWPNNFAGDAFEVDLSRRYATSQAQYHADEPLRRMALLEDMPNTLLIQIQEKVANAQDFDEEWLFRFELWQLERVFDEQRQELEETKMYAETQCQSNTCIKDRDMPLWESTMLWLEQKYAQEFAQSLENDSNGQYSITSPSRRMALIRRARKKAAVKHQAYEAAKADAERLHPGRLDRDLTSIAQTMGYRSNSAQIEDWRERVAKMEKQHLDTIRWREQLPVEAVSAKSTVTRDIEQLEDDILNEKQKLKEFESWVAEQADAGSI